MIDGGEPSGVPVRFALGPDLSGFIRIAAIGVDKIEAFIIGDGSAAAGRRG